MNDASTLVITGMHRSGTSLTAALLKSAGLHIGETLLGRTQSNPRGHFENLDFLNFHKSILKSQNLSEKGWTFLDAIPVHPEQFKDADAIIERNTKAPIWGWKDPRTTLFLDFWAVQLPTAHFLLVYRSPWEVVSSLYTRLEDLEFADNPELAFQVWCHYNKKILNFYRQFPERSLLINVNTLVDFPGESVQVINEKFGLEFRQPSSTVVDTSLLNQKHLTDDYIQWTKQGYPEAIELYQTLEVNAWRPQAKPAQTWIKQLQAAQTNPLKTWYQFKHQEAELAQLRGELKQTKQLLDRSQIQINQTELELENRFKQLHQTQEVLEEYHFLLKDQQAAFSKLKFEQLVAGQPDEQYQTLVWDACHAYCQHDFSTMTHCLKQSMLHKRLPKTQLVMDWLRLFDQYHQANNLPFDSGQLTEQEEWKTLVRSLVVGHGMS